MPRILNWELLANPWNWVIILLMVYIVGLASAAIFHKSILPVGSTGA